jgi:hypothetical protein
MMKGAYRRRTDFGPTECYCMYKQVYILSVVIEVQFVVYEFYFKVFCMCGGT